MGGPGPPMNLAPILLKMRLEKPQMNWKKRVFSRRSQRESGDMQVVVQVINQMGSGNMQTQVLKYDVTYDQRLEITRWQLLPGQGELIQVPEVPPQGLSPER